MKLAIYGDFEVCTMSSAFFGLGIHDMEVLLYSRGIALREFSWWFSFLQY